MGTITIDLRYLDKLSVEVTAVGVTGHTVVVNDHIHPVEDAVAAPTGATKTTTTDVFGRKSKKISVAI